MISVTNNYKVDFVTAVWLLVIHVYQICGFYICSIFFISSGNITAKFSVTDY